jgi:hypothetical protein
LKSKSFLRHPSNLKFGQDFQLRLNQRFLREMKPALNGENGLELRGSCFAKPFRQTGMFLKI